MTRQRFVRWAFLTAAIFAATIGWLYGDWIGFPRHIAGHWVHPRVTWYWTGYPLQGHPFPAIVAYVYTDQQGHEMKHGPYIERGVRGSTVILAKTGFYLNDQPDGIFTEYQTYWGTKVHETRYDHGTKLSEVWYPVPPLNNPPREK